MAWRQTVAAPEQAPSKWPPPNHAAIAGFVFALALITWTVRVWYPVDKWVPLLWVVPAEPAHLPLYVTLFVAGIAARLGNWLRRMPTRTGIIWFGVGLIASAGVYVAHAIGPWDALMEIGGLNLSSLVRSTWETVIAASLSVGLIVMFREVFDRPNRLLIAMAGASFGAYILHPAIVVALQAGIQSVVLPAFAKFALVSGLGTVLAFWLAQLSRKVPGLRVMLGTAS